MLTLAGSPSVFAEGSRNLYPVGTQGTRASLEWRTSVYGPSALNLKRRTLLKAYVQQGEYLLLGSTAMGVAAPLGGQLADIRVYNPTVISDTIGNETFPPLQGLLNDPARPGAFANGFSCATQRQANGHGTRGRIANRAQELAGPRSTTNPGGYLPCFYQAPATGIYNIMITGPAGPDSNSETNSRGLVEWSATDPTDAGPQQDTAVTAWDATVRANPTTGSNIDGRLFTYYYAGFTGGNGRTTQFTVYVVTADGFVYEVTYNGDPYGFIFYVNRKGFEDTRGTPLYRNVLSSDEPGLNKQAQDQLEQLQGDVRLTAPEYPIFFSRPLSSTLKAIGLPANPVPPSITNFSFSGVVGGSTTLIGRGGTFRFTTAQQGVYTIVISRDGKNFDPTDERNRVLRAGANTPGVVSVRWDGRDNAEQLFPVGDQYLARMFVQAGEVHFPFLDVENNPWGGPTITLLNPPDRDGDQRGDCPPWNGGCRGAFYDDRGYETTDGELVGTAINGPLCPTDAANPRGFGNPPLLLASDPLLGFDTFFRADLRGTGQPGQRRFGFDNGGNPERICLPDGGFGDKKGLDLWTFYPSNVLLTPLRIINTTAIRLASFSATAESSGTVVRWTTSSEQGTLGFRLYRSSNGNRADAQLLTPTLLAAQGLGGAGATYGWEDAQNLPGASYWLVEETGNGSTEYGPVQATQAGQAGAARLLLPFVVR